MATPQRSFDEYGPLSELDQERMAGYRDGGNLAVSEPGHNRHPAYIHGFRCGRDDARCSKGLQKHPSRTAAQARADWAAIEAMLAD